MDCTKVIIISPHLQFQGNLYLCNAAGCLIAAFFRKKKRGGKSGQHRAPCFL